MEPSPKAAVPEEEEEDGGGDESEALLGSSSSKNTPVVIAPSRDTVKVESEPSKPTVSGARVKKPYLNTDV